MHKIRFDNHPSLPFDFDTPESLEAETKRSANSPADPSSRLLRYISFGSGSSGNSCYIGSQRGGIIIDAGVKADIIEQTLADCGIRMNSIGALLLTHDHSDHVRYAYNLLRNNRHIKLFCTNRVLNGLLRRHCISKRIKEYHSPVFKEIPFKIFDFEVTAFDVPHDGSDNMGFSLNFDNRNFVVATDLGCVAERARFYLSQADYMVIEANYDLEMLRNGRYPEYLKVRIQTANGHLDNLDTARFVAETAGGRLRHIFLCHLSQDNNTPQLALTAVKNALEAKGLTVGAGEETPDDRKADLQLTVLPRFSPTRLYVFRP